MAKRNYSLRLIALIGTAIVVSLQLISAQTKYQIYPTPQTIVQGDKTLTMTKSVHICAESSIDQPTRQRAQNILVAAGYETSISSDTIADQTNLILGVNSSNGIADQYATVMAIERSVFENGSNKFDQHLLHIIPGKTAPRILILGKNTDGTFFGLASLEQILEQSPKNQITNAKINDFSFQEIRGFVEGFYGFPWYFKDKISLMRYAMRFKLNSYIYGPKSDPYHLGYWKNDYPTTLTPDQEHRGWLSQEDLRQLAQESNATKVRFIWAAHPALQNGINFQTTAGADQGVADLMKKFEHLYSLGVRDFGVFVDDISVDDAVRDRVQHKYLMNQLHDKLTQRYNTDGADPADTIRPLHFVPTPYPTSWGTATQREQYFGEIKQIHSSIRIYHTGRDVWSSIDKASFTKNNAECGRTTSMWWNYPCNDDGHNKMKMGPINQLFNVDKSIKEAQGVVANPMTQPQCSKVALFGLADYCWNTPKFDATKNWENSFASLIPDDENLRKALRLFALHSSENKEPQSLVDLYNTYKSTPLAENPLISSRLKEQIDSISWAYNELQRLKTSENEDYQFIYRDIRPWLNKLNSMASVISLTIEGQKSTDNIQQRIALFTKANKIYQAFNTNPDHQLEKLNGYGTGSNIEITAAIPSNVQMKGFAQYIQQKAAKTICNETPPPSTPELFSNRTATTGFALHNEEGTMAINGNNQTLLPKEYIGINMNQLQRIESVVSDIQITNLLDIQYSTNGKEWIGITSDTNLPIAAYVRLYNSKTENVTFSTNKELFALNVTTPAKIVSATQNTSAGIHQGSLQLIYDANPATFFWTNNKQVAGDNIVFQLSRPTPIHDVNVIFNANDRPGEARIDGSMKVFSVFKQIVDLMYENSMDKNGDNYNHLTEGNGTMAQYIRLYITKPYNQYWLRFSEIEINKKHIRNSTLSQGVTDFGISINALSDRNMITSYTPNTGNKYLEYNLIRNERTQTIDIYQNIEDIEGKEAPKVTALSGKEWVELGHLDQSLTSFDVAQLTNLQKIRISWQTGTAPTIHEIIEKGIANNEEILNLDETSTQNRIKTFTIGNEINIFAQGTIQQIRLFDSIGRSVHQQTVNDSSCRLKAPSSQNTYIVQVILSDGTQQTVKHFTQK